MAELLNVLPAANGECDNVSKKCGNVVEPACRQAGVKEMWRSGGVTDLAVVGK